jgi:hypothetical protein
MVHLGGFLDPHWRQLELSVFHHDSRSNNMSGKHLFVGFACCAVACTLAENRTNAQVKPFQIIGWGIGPDGLPLPGEPPRPHWAIGEANLLGFYYGEGEVETDTATFNSDGTITGQFGSGAPFVFTASNGDQLACYYGRTEFGASTPGTFTLVPVPGKAGWYVAHWIAEFVPYDPLCTGEFQGVTGGWTMYAQSAPFELGSSDPAYYWWEGRGALAFPRRNDH